MELVVMAGGAGAWARVYCPRRRLAADSPVERGMMEGERRGSRTRGGRNVTGWGQKK